MLSCDVSCLHSRNTGYYCEIACIATRRQVTWSGSTEMPLGSYSLGPHAQSMRSCSQAEKQAPASKGLEVALLQKGMRKPRARGFRAEAALIVCVMRVFWESAIFPDLGSKQTFPVCAPCSSQQKEYANEPESEKSLNLSLSQ